LGYSVWTYEVSNWLWQTFRETGNYEINQLAVFLNHYGIGLRVFWFDNIKRGLASGQSVAIGRAMQFGVIDCRDVVSLLYRHSNNSGHYETLLPEGGLTFHVTDFNEQLRTSLSPAECLNMARDLGVFQRLRKVKIYNNNRNSLGELIDD
jgi:hypothetical protein